MARRIQIAFLGVFLALWATMAQAAAPTYYGNVVIPAGDTLNMPGLSATSSVCTDGSSNIVTSGCTGGGGVTSITAGENIVVTGTASVPIVATTDAPTFGGTITDSASTPLAFTTTGLTTITTASTGSHDALTINNSGAVTAGQHILNLNYGGTNKWSVDTSGVTTGIEFIANQATAFRNSSANTMGLQSGASGSAVQFTMNDSASTTGDLLDLYLGTAANPSLQVLNKGETLARGNSTTSEVISAIPPLYSQTMTQMTTAWSQIGTCSISAAVNPSCTVTFSGTGSGFTSTSTYACATSQVGILPAGLPNENTNTSGTVETITITGTVTTGGTEVVVCTGN